jgi:hypothetical protein
MKKIIITLLVLVFNLTGAGEIVKLNQEKPLNPRAGRELMIKKVLQIGDEKSGFLFGSPMELRAADDGSFYVMEFNKLYKFSAGGKFLKSLCRIGEGPGEVGQLYNFILQGNSVVMFSVMPDKISRFDLDGKFLNENKIMQKISSFSTRLLTYWKDKYYIIYSTDMPLKKDPYFVDIDHYLAVLSADGQNVNKLGTFPIQKYVMIWGEGGMRSFSIGDFNCELFKNRYLIISHTPEYLLKIFDLEENRITTIFSRKYPRVKFQGKRWGKNPVAPKLEFENDIKKIFPQEKEIWVLTSTANEKDGALIDVFDSTGNYADNFYVKVPGNILCIKNNSIFVSEEDSEYNQLVVQYLIMVK